MPHPIYFVRGKLPAGRFERFHVIGLLRKPNHQSGAHGYYRQGHAGNNALRVFYRPLSQFSAHVVGLILFTCSCISTTWAYLALMSTEEWSSACCTARMFLVSV